MACSTFARTRLPWLARGRPACCATTFAPPRNNQQTLPRPPFFPFFAQARSRRARHTPFRACGLTRTVATPAPVARGRFDQGGRDACDSIHPRDGTDCDL